MDAIKLGRFVDKGFVSNFFGISGCKIKSNQILN